MSVIAIAGVPSSVRRCRADLPADVSVSPSRSGGAARLAVCRVSKVTRSADVAKPRELTHDAQVYRAYCRAEERVRG